MTCPCCGTGGVVRIEVAAAGETLALHHCTSGCQRHWWSGGDGEPAALRRVLDFARRVPARPAGPAPAVA